MADVLAVAGQDETEAGLKVTYSRSWRSHPYMHYIYAIYIYM